MSDLLIVRLRLDNPAEAADALAMLSSRVRAGEVEAEVLHAANGALIGSYAVYEEGVV